MHINHQVVHALMELRRIDIATLARLSHATVKAMQSWVYSGDDEALSFDQQLEVLSFLGVRGERPRDDVVHYWYVHENLFSRSSKNYWALEAVLKAFGQAEAVFISRESDPALNFKAQAHFGLKFQGFMAILAVTAHPLRSITFDPDTMEDLSWAPDTLGVLLPDEEYVRLEPGAMQVKSMSTYLAYSTEVSHWERLREQAIANGIRAEQVASVLLGNAVRPNVRLENSVEPEAAKTVADEVKGSKDAAAANPEQPAKAEEKAPPALSDLDLFKTPVRQAASA